MSEVVALNQTDQFVGAHTAYACGFFAVMMCTSMAPPGQVPTKSSDKISNPEPAYSIGADLATAQVGLHYH